MQYHRAMIDDSWLAFLHRRKMKLSEYKMQDYLTIWEFMLEILEIEKNGTFAASGLELVLNPGELGCHTEE